MLDRNVLLQKEIPDSQVSSSLWSPESGSLSKEDRDQCASTKPKASIVLKSLLLGLLAAASGFVLDHLLHKDGIPRRDLLITGNIALGLIIGAVFYKFAKTEERRRIFAENRLKAIGEMNHHIRNALQVISCHQFLPTPQNQIAIMNQAVKRIEWALQEVLPKFPEKY